MLAVVAATVLVLRHGVDPVWLWIGYPKPAVRLRRTDDPASGFMLDPELRERFPYGPGAVWVLPRRRGRRCRCPEGARNAGRAHGIEERRG